MKAIILISIILILPIYGCASSPLVVITHDGAPENTCSEGKIKVAKNNSLQSTIEKEKPILHCGSPSDLCDKDELYILPSGRYNCRHANNIISLIIEFATIGWLIGF